MPYIKQDERDRMDAGEAPLTPGQLNYCITKLIVKFLPHTPSYYSFNDVLGVLECAKLELYRRMVAAYEDTKIVTNGDVYIKTVEPKKLFSAPSISIIKDTTNDKSPGGCSDVNPGQGKDAPSASLERRATEAT